MYRLHLFIQSLIDGYLNCFHLSAIVNSAVLNICVQVFCVNVLFSLCGMHSVELLLVS